MPSKALIYQLQSPDPKERFTAIRSIAKSKDVTMLNALAKVAETDDDEQVRAVAARAITFIKGESKAGTRSAQKQAVTPQEEARAKGHVDAAVGYQLNGDKERALKELAKAVEVNPKLEGDAYYISVLEEATGITSEEALSLITDRDKVKRVTVNERQLKREKIAKDHQKDVNRSSWASAGMDLVIYTLILVFATAFIPIIVSQSMQAYIAGFPEAQARYEELLAAGDPRATPPLQFTGEVEQIFTQFADMGLLIAVVIGVAVGIYGLVAMLLQLSFTHLAARFIFSGQATLPHLIYKVVSYYNTRLPILYGLIYLSIFLTFQGADLFTGILGLVISLFNLFIAIKVIGRVGETYNFGSLQGCLSVIIGSVAIGILSTVAWFLLAGALFGLMDGMGLNFAMQ
jgi:hypothetical protein